MRFHRIVVSAMWALGAAGFLAACGGGGGGSMPPPPSVTITVQPTSITLGQSATLSWSATQPSSSSYNGGSTVPTCTASGAWSGSQAASGTQAVQPSTAGSAAYTLSCSGPGGTTAATATLTVNPPSAFSLTSLISDGAVPALTTDPNLVNPWGLSIPAGAPAWVANNGTQTSTVYDGNGVGQPSSAPRVVKFAPSIGGNDFDPTGIVFNGSSTDFVLTANSTSAAAKFIFDGEGGLIGGWASSVDAVNVINVYDDGSGGAVYKGLAIANNGSGNFLYATDFHNNKIDVFNGQFVKQTPSAGSFAFTDPNLPTGYAPFGIQAINNGSGGATQLYVSYAQQDADAHDNNNGAGLGLIDIYDTNGNLLKTLIPAGGALNAPWGLALAPADFGTASNALLVGNFGDGLVNAFDPANGQLIGSLKDPSGTPIAIPGLWGIAFGNDVDNQPHNTLFVAAGINDEANGQYARIDLGATPPVLNAPPVVTLASITSPVSGTVALSATVTDSINIAKVQFFANGSNLIGTATASPYTVQWDTTQVADGSVTIAATATDVDGNVGSSTPATVTVANSAPVVSVALTAPSGNLSGTVSLSATVQNGSGITQVQFLANGSPLTLNGAAVPAATTAPYTVQWNTNSVANGTVNLTAKATDTGGNVTTSDAVPVTVANAAVTLSQIQSAVFTPICSSCHTGGGSSLPSSMNLNAGQSFSNIVNVASIELASLERIKPGDPDNSYLIQKVEGAPGITGSRMPQGCSGSSCLSQTTIDMMRQWVYAGAQNN